MDAIKSLNLGIRFLLELCVLAAMGYWGFKSGSGWFLKILFGIGAPLFVAVIWGMFGAPKAPYHLTGLNLLVLEVVVFGSGVMALIATRNSTLAGILTVVLIINRVMIFVWKQ